MTVQFAGVYHDATTEPRRNVPVVMIGGLPELNPERLVFIDETGAATDMARRYGRCPRGQRLVSSVPWGHWRTTRFVLGAEAGRSPGTDWH